MPIFWSLIEFVMICFSLIFWDKNCYFKLETLFLWLTWVAIIEDLSGSNELCAHWDDRRLLLEFRLWLKQVTGAREFVAEFDRLPGRLGEKKPCEGEIHNRLGCWWIIIGCSLFYSWPRSKSLNSFWKSILCLRSMSLISWNLHSFEGLECIRMFWWTGFILGSVGGSSRVWSATFDWESVVS